MSVMLYFILDSECVIVRIKIWKLETEFISDKDQILYFENVEIGTEVLLQTLYCLYYFNIYIYK